jgi:hypothetical protein
MNRLSAVLVIIAVGTATAGASAAPAATPTAAAPAATQSAAFPADVPGFVAPAAGEHPRLLFRAAELPAIRKRAQTPQGKAIVERLKVLLGGGEEMPTVYNPQKAAYEKKGGPAMPIGAYSISHAAGFGMLYQLTGERKYADLGRQCFEKAFEGIRDRDGEARYSFKAPGGALRAGPSLAAYALGYDLCYDGWDDAYRQKVAAALANYNEGPDMNIESMAAGKRQFPACNHWGGQIAGPAMALLAVRGDAGVDDKKVSALLKTCEKSFVRQLEEGWGDHGWFAEGDGPGTIASDTAFLPALQAWRVAGGKDFITPRPAAQWMTLKWVMLTLPRKDAATLAGKEIFPSRGVYDHNVWERSGMSGSGQFAQGFGAVADEYKPALLWLYNHAFRDADEKAAAPCDTINAYPHRAVLALVNWPMDAKEANPATVLPHAVQDKSAAFYMFRNRWQDGDDIIVTALLKGSKGNYSVAGGDIIIWGLGKKTKFPVAVTGAPTFFEAGDAGGVVSTSAGSFGVDFSGASGADGLFVLAGAVTGPAPKGAARVECGKNTFTVMTLQKGDAPTPKADGEKLIVGNQTVSYDGKRITFAQTRMTKPE